MNFPCISFISQHCSKLPGVPANVQHKIYRMSLYQIHKVRIQSRVFFALNQFISEQSRNFMMELHAFVEKLQKGGDANRQDTSRKRGRYEIDYSRHASIIHRVGNV